MQHTDIINSYKQFRFRNEQLLENLSKCITKEEFEKRIDLMKYDLNNSTITIENNVTIVEFKKNGEYHREHAPAFIRYAPRLEEETKLFYFEGKLHRTDGPATIKEHGCTTTHEYYENGVKTPKTENFFDDMFSNGKSTYYNGKYHSYDGEPARTVEIYGEADLREWYDHGVLHRLNGPAITDYDYSEFYENGKFIKRIDHPVSP